MSFWCERTSQRWLSKFVYTQNKTVCSRGVRKSEREAVYHRNPVRVLGVDKLDQEALKSNDANMI